MDPKMIEMNNLRVLHDYLNQTLDVLVRGQRVGNGHAAGIGYSPFAAPIAGAPGTDVVYGPSPYQFGGSPLFNGISPFAATNPFTGLPLINGGYGQASYGQASYSPFGAWPQQGAWTAGQTPWTAGQTPWTAGQTPWTAGQTPWTAGQGAWPGAEVARQAQLTQALAAKQSVLEAMCRVAGIPV
jgi:hypothetical protein